MEEVNTPPERCPKCLSFGFCYMPDGCPMGRGRPSQNNPSSGASSGVGSTIGSPDRMSSTPTTAVPAAAGAAQTGV